SLASVYSDAREHGHQGPTRTVRLPRATSSGGGTIAKSEDGERCVVAGRLCVSFSLRILRLSDGLTSISPDYRSKVGRGGHRIDAERNMWALAGFKVESVTTDVAWGRQSEPPLPGPRLHFDNKILTSARNGDLLLWDINKIGQSKYEKRARDHLRSINKLSLSSVVPYYCLTGSADGDLRVWDIRSFEKSLIRIHHIQPVRTAVFSPSQTNPLQAIVGLDNGSLYRWDLKMGHRGQLDRIPVAHAGPILSLDWCLGPSDGAPVPQSLSRQDTLTSGDIGGSSNASGTGWLASGGMDRTVKVWDLNSSGNTAHISQIPTYTLFTSFPVRRALWRPDYECELAIVSNAEFGTGSSADIGEGEERSPAQPILSSSPEVELGLQAANVPRPTDTGDPIEIWDVRRSYLAKWVVQGSTIEGGVTDTIFRDSHALWAVHSSGTFSQLDVRNSYRPIDAVPRNSVAWDAGGTIAFVSDRYSRFEVPYDDVAPAYRQGHPDALLPKKVLGDSSYKPVRQVLGSVGLGSLPEYAEMFEKLSKNYIFEETDKHFLCGHNAKIALDAGHAEAAQIWTFIQSLYDPLPPPTPAEDVIPPLSPLSLKPHILPHSHSAPASVPTVHTIQTPAPPAKTRPSTIDLAHPSRSPHHSPTPLRTPSQASSNSNSNSPHRASSSIPATGASPVSVLSSHSGSGSTRGSFVFSRRASNTSILRPRALSSYNRPSLAQSAASGAPGPLKHVGEGALDDSDSSGVSGDEARGKQKSKGKNTPPSVPEEEQPASPETKRILPPAAIRTLSASSSGASPSPSPLQNAWTGGSDGEQQSASDGEGETPSPRSTDSSDSDSGRRPSSVRLLARKSASKTRQRPGLKGRASSLVVPLPPPLIKQGSQSSIRTVTAQATGEDDAIARPASRARSQRVLSGGSLQPVQVDGLFSPTSEVPDDAEPLDDQEAREREERMRARAWVAVGAAVEGAIESGDVQTAAIVVLVCKEKLGWGNRRVVRVVESYVDLLNRLRLHSSAAHIRKYASYPDVQEPTQLQTTVYISCGKCEKPVLRQGALCASCRAPTMKCSICRLPVHAMTFLCAICAHGGHLSCYRSYLSARPPDVLRPPSPSPTLAQSRSRSLATREEGSRGGKEAARESNREGGREMEGKELVGRVCAAGCGHMCW
ncbi:hypothetical protein K488DRAFT_11759, partial [Vararia minispora EC-137]